MLDIFRRRPVASSSEEIEAVTAEAEAATEAQSEQELEPEHAAGTSSRSSYQRLASSEEEIDALRAAVCTLQAEMSALKGPQPSTSTSYDSLQEETNSRSAKRSGHSEGPPLLPLCVGGGCIQDASAELSNSVYFISLLRVVSLLKATRVSRNCPTSEAPANARPRLAAAGWATLLLVAALCQIFLMVLILETSTSSTCSVEHQSGCRSGEYCSFSIAKGQCNDCSVILPNTTKCCPTLDTFCPVKNFPYGSKENTSITLMKLRLSAGYRRQITIMMAAHILASCTSTASQRKLMVRKKLNRVALRLSGERAGWRQVVAHLSPHLRPLCSGQAT